VALTSRRAAVWTPAQLAEFLSSIASHPMCAPYHLIAMRGLRRGEACGLRWDDVDLDEESPIPHGNSSKVPTASSRYAR
jgi:integrase